ncbi:hypothetical protein [Qipengyuania qiaonensis]|uniref:Uncharacterized protein n=1 Tax=Qipengyuania qiaonensis TaxID=2867240 RepID=A0ABS7J920_9SPHN|nr:hypothetical protein [Qipengyuania qiaonensis]MBX7483821.1 hypothetical protein [Qipengyuania qiaonensis]
MVRDSLISIFMVVLLGLSVTAWAQDWQFWPELVRALDGSDDVDEIGGESALAATPLSDNADEIAAARFFSESARRDPLLATDRALAHFEASCAARAGLMLDQADERTEQFAERVLAHLTRPIGEKYQWRGRAAICDGADGVPLAGMVSVVKDNSGILRDGDAGSCLFGSIFGMSNETAIYLFRPDRLPTRQSFVADQTQEAERLARAGDELAQERQELALFHSELEVGDETNCGLVIEIRGPLAEIAVPANRRAPNGAKTFWSRIDRLAQPYTSVCSFGQ